MKTQILAKVNDEKNTNITFTEFNCYVQCVVGMWHLHRLSAGGHKEVQTPSSLLPPPSSLLSLPPLADSPYSLHLPLVLALIRNRSKQTLEVSSRTTSCMSVLCLLGQWVLQWASARGIDLAFTTVMVNKDYHAARHRDSGNTSLSVVRVMGNCTGGELLYWPCDPQKINVSRLSPKDAETLDVMKSFVLIDGHCTHDNRQYNRQYTIQ